MSIEEKHGEVRGTEELVTLGQGEPLQKHCAAWMLLRHMVCRFASALAVTVIPPWLTEQGSKVSTTAITSRDLRTWCFLFSWALHPCTKVKSVLRKYQPPIASSGWSEFLYGSFSKLGILRLLKQAFIDGVGRSPEKMCILFQEVARRINEVDMSV